MNIYLKNARVVLEQAVVDGDLYIRDDVFHDALPLVGKEIETVDCEGDFLLPGLVDLHTDNVEQHAWPRPGVTWPAMLAAVLAYDWQLVGGGITTVLDSLSLGDSGRSGERVAIIDTVVRALTQARSDGLFRADHYLHLRCELSDPAMMTIFDGFIGNESLRLASLMDHTPGQRQFRDVDLLRSYRHKKHGQTWSDEEFEQFLAEGRENLRVRAPKSRSRIAEVCHTHRIPLASHDDTTISDVEESYRSRATISEFPTTVAAARRARELSMRIVMGAPNVVLGGSHSGNVSALELANEGLLDILTSDYVPGSLLHAAFKLADCGFDLARAVAMVTASPADAVGFTDRGRIASGLRADLLLVRLVDGIPVIRGIWIGGRRVL